MRSTILLADQIKKSLFENNTIEVQYHGDIEKLKRGMMFCGILEKVDIRKVKLSFDRSFYIISKHELTKIEKIVESVLDDVFGKAKNQFALGTIGMYGSQPYVDRLRVNKNDWSITEPNK